MRRITVALIVVLALFVQSSPAAYTSKAVMEMRSTGTSNLNSGVFDSGVAIPGTDFSQQDASQANGTDLVSANGTNAACKVTSIGRSFDVVDEGNSITISAGTNWLASIYIITDTDGTGGAILDKACGSTDILATGTWREGGAYPGGNNTTGISDDGRMELMVPGSTVTIKNGTYTLNTISITAAGTIAAPIYVRGYNTARGDSPTGSTRPILSMGANAYTEGAFWDVRNVQVTGTAATMFSLGANSTTAMSKFTNSSPTAARLAVSAAAAAGFFGNEVVSMRGIGINEGSSAFLHLGNYFHDTDRCAIMSNSDTTSRAFVNNIFENCISTAIGFSGAAPAGPPHIIGNTFYGAESKMGIGIYFGGSSRPNLMNNIFYGLALGSTITAVTNYQSEYNDYFNNTQDTWNLGKSISDFAVNPVFTNVRQVTGTKGAFVAGNNELVDTTTNFVSSGVVAGDFVLITAGTGFSSPAYPYLIDSIGTTTNSNDTLNITLPASPGTDTTVDKVYQITTGHNFLPTASSLAAYPGVMPGAFSTSSQIVGAIQKASTAGGASTKAIMTVGQ